MNDFSTWQFGECRRTKPTWTTESPASTTRWSSSASARVRASGFSTSTCLPASTAAIAQEAWELFQVQIETRAISGSASSSCGSASARTAPCFSATAWARSRFMSATAISSTSSFAEYAARWDWAMLPAPMTPTRNFVMRVSFTWGSGEQVLGVGDPALAAQEAALPALELDRGTAGEVGVADRAGHCTKVDVAVADHRPAQVLAAAAAEPAGTRVGIGRADVEVLEVDHHRVGQVLGDGDRGVLVDAHEVADIQRGAEVRLVDRMDDAPYPLRGLHEEAVVLEAGGDAAACRVLRDLLARGDDVGEHLLEQRDVDALVAGVRHHVVAHPRDPQPCGEVHVLLHPCDLRRIPGGEVRADRQVGQRDAGRGGVLADAVHVRGIRG